MNNRTIRLLILLGNYGCAGLLSATNLAGNPASNGNATKPIGATIPHVANQTKLGHNPVHRVAGQHAPKTSQDKLMERTKAMESNRMSFNQSYLNLQKAQQNQSKSYNTVSHIMKTKHDTVKSTINNVR